MDSHAIHATYNDTMMPFNSITTPFISGGLSMVGISILYIKMNLSVLCSRNRQKISVDLDQICHAASLHSKDDQWGAVLFVIKLIRNVSLD